MSDPVLRSGLEMMERLEAAEATVREYERRINWDTTCGNCATLLDSSIKETERAERAEEQLRLANIDAVNEAARANEAEAELAEARVEHSREVGELLAKLDSMERGIRSVIENADDLGVPGMKFGLRRIVDGENT